MPESTFRIKGSHVVVTGASRGVGAAIARELVARGARTTMIARSQGPLESLAAQLGARPVVADLADREVVDGLIRTIERESGPVDVLINNAAVAHVGLLAGSSNADIADTINVNLSAPIVLSNQVLPGMLDRGTGRIVNISSLAALVAIPSFSVYGATKAGLAQFTATVQRELRPSTVRMTLVYLGEVADTGIWTESLKVPIVAATRQRFDRVKALGRLPRFCRDASPLCTTCVRFPAASMTF